MGIKSKFRKALFGKKAFTFKHALRGVTTGHAGRGLNIKNVLRGPLPLIAGGALLAPALLGTGGGGLFSRLLSIPGSLFSKGGLLSKGLDIAGKIPAGLWSLLGRRGGGGQGGGGLPGAQAVAGRGGGLTDLQKLLLGVGGGVAGGALLDKLLPRRQFEELGPSLAELQARAASERSESQGLAQQQTARQMQLLAQQAGEQELGAQGALKRELARGGLLSSGSLPAGMLELSRQSGEQLARGGLEAGGQEAASLQRLLEGTRARQAAAEEAARQRRFQAEQLEEERRRGLIGDILRSSTEILS